jgi:hypothetical protein
MTRKILLAAGAAVVLGWAGQAAAETVGHIGADYNRANISVDSLGDANGDVWGVEGAVALPVTAPLNISLDGAVQNFHAEGENATTLMGTGHVDYRLNDATLLGGFVGVNHSDDVTVWGLGVEGQYTGATGGVVGQFGYAKSEDIDGVDFWGERVEGRFYGNDNLRFAASLGGLQIKTDFGDTSAWNAGVNAEYQFASMPISVWGGYERDTLDDADLSADVFSIGIRYNFGGTLRSRDAAGTTMGNFGQVFGGALGNTAIAIVGNLGDYGVEF